MEEKNELNDLFLGEETKNSGSKKLFLIIAGALLVFFVTIGIMKFVNSSDDKTQNTNATKESNASAQRPPVDSNGSANATLPNDEKLNEIVRKLQEDAKNQAGQTTPLDANTTIQPKTTVVTVPAQPAPAPVVAATATPKPAQKAPAPAQAVTTPVQPAAQAQKAPTPAPAPTPKETLDGVKDVAKPAPKAEVKPKPVAKPAPKAEVKPKPAPVVTPAPAAETQGGEGGFYVQVGYYDGQKNVDSLANKVSSAGYKTINRTAQVKDKNVTKVLAGPFNSKAEAQTELTKIRQQIKADAFITK